MPTDPPHIEHLGAIVVSHDPPADLGQRLLRLLAEIPLLTLIDNASTAKHWAALWQDLQRSFSGPGGDPAGAASGNWRLRTASGAELRLIRLPENVGIAGAYSRGLQELTDAGCTHGLLLDHDSKLPEGAAAQLLAVRAAAPADAFGVVPCLRHPHPQMRCRWPQALAGSRWRFRFVYATDLRAPTPVDIAISSGMLLDLDRLQALGGFRDELFIDLVDTELCLRARDRGWRLYAAPGVWMPHSIGQPSARGPAGMTLYPTNHGALRHYYLARNRIHLYHWHARSHPFWALYETLAALKLIAKVCLFESGRRAKIGAMLRGTRDGLAGRLGPAPRP